MRRPAKMSPVSHVWSSTRIKRSVAELDEALSGEGADSQSLLAAGKVFEIDGELGAAELAYGAALEVDPTNVESAGRLAMPWGRI